MAGAEAGVEAGVEAGAMTGGVGDMTGGAGGGMTGAVVVVVVGEMLQWQYCEGRTTQRSRQARHSSPPSSRGFVEKIR